MSVDKYKYSIHIQKKMRRKHHTAGYLLKMQTNNGKDIYTCAKIVLRHQGRGKNKGLCRHTKNHPFGEWMLISEKPLAKLVIMKEIADLEQELKEEVERQKEEQQKKNLEQAEKKRQMMEAAKEDGKESKKKVAKKVIQAKDKQKK